MRICNDKSSYYVLNYPKSYSQIFFFLTIDNEKYEWKPKMQLIVPSFNI